MRYEKIFVHSFIQSFAFVAVRNCSRVLNVDAFDAMEGGPVSLFWEARRRMYS